MPVGSNPRGPGCPYPACPLLVLGAAARVGLGVLLGSSSPRLPARRVNRSGRNCPNCGSGFRVRAVVPDDRPDGMLECRACSRVRDPEWHRA
ncbi:hypothetical protein OG596_06930 [Streptomyces sp. NBC_01102]|uniref:hypothetical protein n=1 Tax=unclassified Streptomyces TaxID=2593676 RepID=UPI00386C1DA5|nr:hypothetical protein OG596_06930 [Streptomyces sp. NBC_01102]